MPGFRSADRWLLLAADRHHMGTTRMKTAARGRMQGARDVAGQALPRFTATLGRVRDRHGGDQALSIGMHGLGVERAFLGDLHHFPEIHDSDAS